jgi:hypothetical protein
MNVYSIKMLRRKRRMTQFKIPLENIEGQEREKLINEVEGKSVVRVSDEPCLTCGHKTRLVRIREVEGKKVLVSDCLYCMCRYHLKSNDEMP